MIIEKKKKGTEILSKWDTNHDGQLDMVELEALTRGIKSTDTKLRYTGYTFVIPTILRSAVRYSAYLSDFGESFRPIISSKVVRLTYAMSWSYVIGDVAWEGYKARVERKKKAAEVTEIVIERAIFQTFASMLIPMMLIHSTVSIFQKAFSRLSVKPVYAKWGPTLAGLSVVPFLPFIIDQPVECVLEFCKSKVFAMMGRESGHNE